jgi:hypothetical protein
MLIYEEKIRFKVQNERGFDRSGIWKRAIQCLIVSVVIDQLSKVSSLSLGSARATSPREKVTQTEWLRMNENLLSL